MGFWRHRHQLCRRQATGGVLSTWPPGQVGLVTEVSGVSLLAARLREIGVVPGARIRVLRAGCPLVVQVGEGRLCLRRQDAACVHVCPVFLPPSRSPLTSPSGPDPGLCQYDPATPAPAANKTCPLP